MNTIEIVPAVTNETEISLFYAVPSSPSAALVVQSTKRLIYRYNTQLNKSSTTMAFPLPVSSIAGQVINGEQRQLAREERILGLHAPLGTAWLSDDFLSELPDSFWLGEE